MYILFSVKIELALGFCVALKILSFRSFDFLRQRLMDMERDGDGNAVLEISIPEITPHPCDAFCVPETYIYCYASSFEG